MACWSVHAGSYSFFFFFFFRGGWGGGGGGHARHNRQMIDMAKVYIVIPVLKTLTFTQGHRVMRKLEIMQS